MINTLLPYLEGIYPNYNIDYFFNADKIHCCQFMEYNKEKNLLIDPSSEYLDKENLEEEDRWMGFDLTIVHQEEGNKLTHPAKDKFAPSPLDNDSVSN